MANELAVRNNPLTPQTWTMLREIAPVMHQSRLFGVSSPEQFLAIALKGNDLGLPPTTALEVIQVIQGRPTLSPRGALMLVMQSGELAGMKIDDLTDAAGIPIRCRVWMKRRNGLEYHIEVSMDDARRAGLVKPDSGWANWPANMLRARALGFVMDVLFSDVTGGMKRADEFGAAIDDAGDVIPGTWSEPTLTTPAATEPKPITLAELLQKFTPEQIMEANSGKIPATDAEVAQAYAALTVAA